MSVVEGFEVLTGTYLGQDWDLFGETIDGAIALFLHEADAVDIAASILGFETLLANPVTDEEYYDRWIFGLHAGYDPRDDGFTFPEWFSHALNLLQAGPVAPRPELPKRCGDEGCRKCRPALSETEA